MICGLVWSRRSGKSSSSTWTWATSVTAAAAGAWTRRGRRRSRRRTSGPPSGHLAVDGLLHRDAGGLHPADLDGERHLLADVVGEAHQRRDGVVGVLAHG